VKMAQISEQLVDVKVACVEDTGAEVLIGSDCGCLMNIGGLLDRKDKNVKEMHIAQLLNSRENWIQRGEAHRDENLN
ncbi:(Fe-S)-binding protein, partial [Bacillus vallismortis]|nr:(Fe-S)-binding protein [Bacillus vallismortis]